MLWARFTQPVEWCGISPNLWAGDFWWSSIRSWEILGKKLHPSWESPRALTFGGWSQTHSYTYIYIYINYLCLYDPKLQTNNIHTYIHICRQSTHKAIAVASNKGWRILYYNIYIYRERETIPYIYIYICMSMSHPHWHPCLFHFLATTLSGQVLQPGGKKNKSLMERWPGSSYGMYRGETLAFWPNALLDCVLLH